MWNLLLIKHKKTLADVPEHLATLRKIKFDGKGLMISNNAFLWSRKHYPSLVGMYYACLYRVKNKI